MCCVGSSLMGVSNEKESRDKVKQDIRQQSNSVSLYLCNGFSDLKVAVAYGVER